MVLPISRRTMKRTSTSSSKRRTRKPDAAAEISSLTEEERILAFLKKEGFKPMSAKTRKLMAEAGCLGMPDE